MRNRSRSPFETALRPVNTVVATIACLGIAVGVGCDRPDSDAGGTAPAATTPPDPASGSPADPPSDPVAQEPAATSPAVAAPPHVTFERTVHDFGKILDVEIHETSFLFTSDGSEPLVIEKITNSPGCIVLEPAEGDIFVPGVMGMVRIRFEPMAYGAHQKFVHVITNGKPSGFTRLTLAANVEALVSPSPRYVELGGLQLGEEHRSTVALTCSRGPFEIVTLKTTHPNLSAKITPDAAGGTDALQSKTLEIVIDDGAPWGVFGGWVELTSEVEVEGRDEPIEHQLRIPVQAALVGNVVPQPLTMRIISNTGEVWKVMTVLKHLRGAPFEVLEASLESETLTDSQLTVEPAEEGGWLLTLSGVAPATPGNRSGRVLIKTDVEGEVDLAVPVFMQVRGSADG